jgi:hypothetical protein
MNACQVNPESFDYISLSYNNWRLHDVRLEMVKRWLTYINE